MNGRQIANIVAIVVTLAVNGLANALPLNGRQTGQISDSFPSLFTPAGWVFAIWGVIYLGLLAFGVYQALPAQRDNPRLAAIFPWFIASSFFNSVWIFLWHYEQFVLTEIAMLGLLVSLIAIYLRLDLGRRPVGLQEKLAVNATFSTYLGWITVATVANTGVVLLDAGWNGGALGPVLWTVLVILVAAALGLAMIFLRREVAYPLVLIWAFAGIVVRQSAPIPLVAGAMAVLLALAIVYSRLRRPQPGALGAH